MCALPPKGMHAAVDIPSIDEEGGTGGTLPLQALPSNALGRTTHPWYGGVSVRGKPLRLLWGGDDGSDQGTHIRSEGGTDAEAPRDGTQGGGNPQASGDRRQGRSHT